MKIKIIQNSTQLKKLYSSSTKLKTLFNILSSCKNYVYSYPAYNYSSDINSSSETINMFFFINNYFYGSCHEVAFYVKYILFLHNIKSKIIHMSNLKGLSHLALEVKINKQKLFVDPTFGYYFYTKQNRILSLKKIKEFINNKKVFYCNKKISLDKFKNLNSKSYFYYKKIESFKNPKKKYLSLFNQVEIMDLKKNDYKYKKKLRKTLNISDYHLFKPVNFNFKNLKSIQILKKGNGIIEKKIIKSNKLIQFDNYILRFINNSKKIKIRNFPFNIIDLKIFTKGKSNTNLEIITNHFKKKIKVKNNIFNLCELKNIHNEPIKDIEIISNNIVSNFEITTIKTFFKYENFN